MFKSIYKRIVEDFAFLNDYGYYFEYKITHNIRPSVVFGRYEKELLIGYDYEEDRMCLSLFKRGDTHQSENLLDGVSITGHSYKDQVGQVKDVLLKYLTSKR